MARELKQTKPKGMEQHAFNVLKFYKTSFCCLGGGFLGLLRCYSTHLQGLTLQTVLLPEATQPKQKAPRSWLHSPVLQTQHYDDWTPVSRVNASVAMGYEGARDNKFSDVFHFHKPRTSNAKKLPIMFHT